MSDNISSEQFRRYCEAGNRLNAKIESPDFAQVRKGLDDCCETLRQMADSGQIDPYLVAKLTLAFLKGLAITQQREPMTHLINLSKTFAGHENLFADMTSLPTEYDGITIETCIEERLLKLFGMGMYFIADILNCKLETRDLMIFHQCSLIERILYKREFADSENGQYSSSDAKKLINLFIETPKLLLDYTSKHESRYSSEVMGFWEQSLELAFADQVPEECAQAFAEYKKRIPPERLYNNLKLLPMLPWEIERAATALQDKSYAPMVTTGIARLTGPMLLVLTLGSLIALISSGLTTGLFWSVTAFALAGLFFKTSMYFVDEIRLGIGPEITLFIYLFTSLLSIGALVTGPVNEGLFAAIVMNIMFPGMWGAFLRFRRVIINIFNRFK